MNTPSVLHMRPARVEQGLSAFPLSRPSQEPPLESQRRRRCKIWELSPSLHCSIVGTCLTASELRQLLIKFGDIDARAATDHALHKCGVIAAGAPGRAGEGPPKRLGCQHEAPIRQFSKVDEIEGVRDLWRQSFEQGAIPGGYWATITHPATDRALAEEAFGQIHMLSHMIGSSNRTDIRRLRELEKELADRDEKIARQQVRLAESGEERALLRRTIEQLTSDIRANVAHAVVEPGADMEGVIRRLDTEKARSARLSTRVEELEAELAQARRTAASQDKRSAQIESELATLERLLAPPADCCAKEASREGLHLGGRTILYVGGRPSLIVQLKLLCARHGGVLLAHDGGVEESLASLPRLASRADVVVFPVDCVSHSAVGIVRKSCRDGFKAFLPLRTASVASFLDGLSNLSATALHADECC